MRGTKVKKAPFIFSVYSLKGGSAKTSTAVNLAASFASSGHHILYVDMDPQAHGAQRFGMSKGQIAEQSIVGAIQKKTSFESLVFKSESENIDVIAGGSTLRDLVRLHETDKHRAYLLAPVLKTDHLSRYDIILIDTDGKTGPLIESALAVSHGYIAPCPPEKDPINDLGETIHLANQMTDVINPGLDLLGVVITRYDSKLSVHKEYYRQLSEAAAQGNIRVFKSVIPLSNAVPNSGSLNQTLLQYQSTLIRKAALPVTEAHHRLAQEIENLIPAYTNRLPLALRNNERERINPVPVLDLTNVGSATRQ